MDVVGGLGPTWWGHRCHMASVDGPPCPAMSLIYGRAKWHTQECPSIVDFKLVHPKAEVELPWIPVPTVIHLEG
jgi:hypothetical protein